LCRGSGLPYIGWRRERRSWQGGGTVELDGGRHKWWGSQWGDGCGRGRGRGGTSAHYALNAALSGGGGRAAEAGEAAVWQVMVEKGEERRRPGRRRCGRSWWRRGQREVGGADGWAPAVGDWQREGGSAGPAGLIGPNWAAIESVGCGEEKEKEKERADLG
jgi:hypothetical protein